MCIRSNRPKAYRVQAGLEQHDSIKKPRYPSKSFRGPWKRSKDIVAPLDCYFKRYSGKNNMEMQWLTLDITDGAKITFWVICKLPETPTTQRIVEVRDKSVRTIKNHIAELEKAGLVRRTYEPGPKGGNRLILEILYPKKDSK